MLTTLSLIFATSVSQAKYSLKPLPIPVCDASINDSGDVAGTANSEGAARAFLWNHGRVIWMPNKGLNSYFAGLNNWGQVLYSVVQRNGNVEPIQWSGGRTRTLRIPASTDLQLKGLDNNGTVIGTSVPTKEGEFRAFVLWKGAFHWLNIPGNESSALTIGRHGHIVAWWKAATDDSAHIAILKGGVTQELTVHKSGDIGASWGINDHDEVCGSLKGEQAQDGVAWLGGKRANLGANAIPVSINDQGTMVGSAPNSADGSETAASIWMAGQQQSLESLVDLNGWHLLKATGINNSGQIVGRGKDPSGKESMFLLSPAASKTGSTRRTYYSGRRYRRYRRTGVHHYYGHIRRYRHGYAMKRVQPKKKPG